MNRLQLFFIINLFSIPAIFADSNPFLSLAYDSVCIYEFEWCTKNGMFLSIIDKEGKIVSSVKKTTKLNKKEGKKLSKLLGDSSSYGNEVGACFEPHLGIVYYKDGQVTAHVSICLMCNQLKSSIHIPGTAAGS